MTALIQFWETPGAGLQSPLFLCEVTVSEVSKSETHGGSDGLSGASKPEFAKVEPGYDSPDTVLEDAWGRVCQ